MPRYLSIVLSFLLLVFTSTTHAGLARKGMMINVYNRTPFTLRLVEAAKGGSNGVDWRIHYVQPNGNVLFEGKSAGYADDRDLNIFIQRFCPGVFSIAQSALQDQYVQTAVVSVRIVIMATVANDIQPLTGCQPIDRYALWLSLCKTTSMQNYILSTHCRTGTPYVDLLHHCQYKSTGSDRGLRCNGRNSYSLSEHEVMNNGDYLNMGSPDKTDKIFAKLYRGTDTDSWKRFQMYIHHTGFACRDGEPCFGDWRKDVCNRNTY